MMRIIVAILLLPSVLSAQEEEGVMKPVNDYIEGTSYNYSEKVLASFMPGALLFLYNDADTLMIWTAEKYAALYDNGRRGQRNKRYSKVVMMDIVEGVAYVRLEVDIPSFNKRFYDLLLLKEINDEWKIISKSAEAIPLPLTAEEAKPKPAKETIMNGLRRPWSMAFISENEAIIAEKDGNLLLVDLETKERQVISGMPSDVAGAVKIDFSGLPLGTFPADADGKTLSYNAGLFQVLLHPDFAKNRIVYLSYAAEDGEKKSALKVVMGELENATLTSIKTILLAGPYSHGLFHYGGGMAIADGHLYISTGERNFTEKNNPALPLSQDVSDPRGKIFRFMLDGSVPVDNPGFATGAVPGIYALGIRAAQGLTVHPQTGEVWFSEHGTLQGDEINKLAAGANYGWPYETTGKYRSKGYSPDRAPGLRFTAPMHFWKQTVAPTGLTFYYGRDFPQWRGSLIVPGLSGGSLWRLEMDGDEVVGAEELFVNDRVRARKVALSPRGVLYMLTDEDDGRLIRIANKPRAN